MSNFKEELKAPTPTHQVRETAHYKQHGLDLELVAASSVQFSSLDESGSEFLL